MASVTPLVQDSVAQNDSLRSDSVTYRYYVDLKRKPDAMRAVWLGAICPGAGQIYNRSYWKLPIVYGGLMGCGYAIGYTQSRYTDYKTAYMDLYHDMQSNTVEADNAKKSYVALLPKGYTIDRMGGPSSYAKTLQNGYNNYRRYRDLSIAGTALVYALTLVDAYVDAQLFDFDISHDLSMHIQPTFYTDPHTRRTAEVKLAITF